MGSGQWVVGRFSDVLQSLRPFNLFDVLEKSQFLDDFRKQGIMTILTLGPSLEDRRGSRG